MQVVVFNNDRFERNVSYVGTKITIATSRYNNANFYEMVNALADSALGYTRFLYDTLIDAICNLGTYFFLYLHDATMPSSHDIEYQVHSSSL